MNTHDIFLAGWHRVGAFLDAHRAAGFHLGITAEEEVGITNEKNIEMAKLVIQNPARIMINRKK